MKIYLPFCCALFTFAVEVSAAKTAATIAATTTTTATRAASSTSNPYSAELPLAERPSILPKGYWSFNLRSGTALGYRPSILALTSAYPLNDRLQLSGTFTHGESQDLAAQQNLAASLLYQALDLGPWSSLLSASWVQALWPQREFNPNALVLAGTLTHRFKQGPWYLFTTQLLRYHFTSAQDNIQATTSLLGGRQINPTLWLNVGLSLLDFSSNRQLTRSIFDPQPFSLNFVWSFDPAAELSGSLGTTNLPLYQNNISFLLGVTIRTPV